MSLDGMSSLFKDTGMQIYANMAGNSTPQRPTKVILVGEPKSGKSSLLLSGSKPFSSSYKPTAGVGFECKRVFIEGIPSMVQLWDISVMEKHSSVAAVYYRDTDGVMIVYDTSQNESLLGTIKWREIVQSKLDNSRHDVPFVLVGNKIDLLTEDDSTRHIEEAEVFCSEHNFQGVLFTSAKTGKGFDDAVKLMCEKTPNNKMFKANDGLSVNERSASVESSNPFLKESESKTQTDFCFCQ